MDKPGLEVPAPMPAPLELVLLLFLLGAALYTSVGHGGATLYLAILSLAGWAAADLVPTVLVLNIAAALIALINFGWAGHLRTSLLLPLIVTSVPMAYVGGRWALTAQAAELALAIVLLAAAARFLLIPVPAGIPSQPRRRYVPIAMALGAVLGLAAGATGIGGGIFLSPILVWLGWADVRQAGAVASAFIVLNSVAGLAARVPATPLDVGLLGGSLLVVILGASVGSFVGARRLSPHVLSLLLGIVLLAAGLKALLL